MIRETFNLWKETPGRRDREITITLCAPDRKVSKGTVVIFAGGGYTEHAHHEDIEYAEFLASNGYFAFYVDYRYWPDLFPLQLLDARRAVRFVRKQAEKYGYQKDKIAVMGSSAGGHLAALVSNYCKPIEFEGIDEIDREDYIPNAQILCYPVISVVKPYGHISSGQHLLGERYDELKEEFCIEKMVTKKTPPAFICHSSGDTCVFLQNTLNYTSEMNKCGVQTEIHIFPDGYHGMGLCVEDDKTTVHTRQWAQLLLNWLEYMDFR